MYLFIAKDGSVKAVTEHKELKTHFKYAGWEGVAFEVSGVEVDLADFKPKTAPAHPGHPAANLEIAALRADNQRLQSQFLELMAALKAGGTVAAPKKTKRPPKA